MLLWRLLQHDVCFEAQNFNEPVAYAVLSVLFPDHKGCNVIAGTGSVFIQSMPVTERVLWLLNAPTGYAATHMAVLSELRAGKGWCRLCWKLLVHLSQQLECACWWPNDLYRVRTEHWTGHENRLQTGGQQKHGTHVHFQQWHLSSHFLCGGVFLMQLPWFKVPAYTHWCCEAVNNVCINGGP